jgi:hypothetical protein
MKSRVWAGIAVGALVLTACGDGGGAQDEVADMVLEEMGGEGVEMDEDCVRDAAQELSDDDAQKIVDAGPGGNADDLSPEAGETVDSFISCIDTDSLVDQMIDEMVTSEGAENVDVECLRTALNDIDLASIDESSPELMSALFECITIGG